VRVARGREGEPEGVEARTEWECVASSVSNSVDRNFGGMGTEAIARLNSPRIACSRSHLRQVESINFVYISLNVSRASSDLSTTLFAPADQISHPLIAPIVGDYKYGQTSPHFETLSELSIPQDSVLLHSAKISFYVRVHFYHQSTTRLTEVRSLPYRLGAKIENAKLSPPKPLYRQALKGSVELTS